jgi:hypothetical protein
MKEVKNLCNEHHKSLKKSKKTLENGRTAHACGLAESIYVNVYTTKSNLNVQCNPHQNSNDLLQSDRKINPKVQRTLTS